jgi:hypothetical protein
LEAPTGKASEFAGGNFDRAIPIHGLLVTKTELQEKLNVVGQDVRAKEDKKECDAFHGGLENVVRPRFFQVSGILNTNRI